MADAPILDFIRKYAHQLNGHAIVYGFDRAMLREDISDDDVRGMIARVRRTLRKRTRELHGELCSPGVVSVKLHRRVDDLVKVVFHYLDKNFQTTEEATAIRASLQRAASELTSCADDPDGERNWAKDKLGSIAAEEARERDRQWDIQPYPGFPAYGELRYGHPVNQLDDEELDELAQEKGYANWVEMAAEQLATLDPAGTDAEAEALEDPINDDPPVVLKVPSPTMTIKELAARYYAHQEIKLTSKRAKLSRLIRDRGIKYIKISDREWQIELDGLPKKTRDLFFSPPGKA